MILIWNNINKFTYTIIIYKHLHSTFLMAQVYGTVLLYNSFYLSFLQLPSALSHWSSEHLLKALQRAKAFVPGYRGAIWESCEIFRGFSPSSVQSKKLYAWNARSGGTTGLGYEWSYHTCEHIFKKLQYLVFTHILCNLLGLIYQ